MRAISTVVLTGVFLGGLAASAAAQAPPPLGRADAPVWNVGDEWTYRWESPRGKGTFSWVVVREEVMGGVGFYVIKGEGREIYWRKSDLGFHLQTLEGNTEERATPPQRDCWRRRA